MRELRISTSKATLAPPKGLEPFKDLSWATPAMPKLGKIHNPKGCLGSGADQIPPSDLVKIALKLLKFLLFLSCPNCAQSWGRLRISIRLSRSEIREIREVWSWLLQNLPQWLLWVPQLSGWVGDLQNTFCELPQLCPKLGQAQNKHKIE